MRLNTLVLVGYAAEDAALRLLLETLDADRDRFRDLKDIYAIEKRSDDLASLWKAKGINPLEFPDHDTIYEALAEWAKTFRIQLTTAASASKPFSNDRPDNSYGRTRAKNHAD